MSMERIEKLSLLNLTGLLAVMKRMAKSHNPINIEMTDGAILENYISEIIGLSTQKNVLDGSATFLLTEELDDFIAHMERIYANYVMLSAYLEKVSNEAWDLLAGELKGLPVSIIKEEFRKRDMSFNRGFAELGEGEGENDIENDIDDFLI